MEKRQDSYIFIGIRCLLNIILAVISLISEDNKPVYFIVWIVCASIFGLFNTWVDYFYDWEIIAWNKEEAVSSTTFYRLQKRLKKKRQAERAED